MTDDLTELPAPWQPWSTLPERGHKRVWVAFRRNGVPDVGHGETWWWRQTVAGARRGDTYTDLIAWCEWIRGDSRPEHPGYPEPKGEVGDDSIVVSPLPDGGVRIVPGSNADVAQIARLIVGEPILGERATTPTGCDMADHTEAWWGDIVPPKYSNRIIKEAR